MLTIAMNRTRKKVARRISSPKCRIPLSNAVSSGRALSRVAMSPNIVAALVLSTRHCAMPLTTDVPR